jgi:hypothetical protein
MRVRDDRGIGRREPRRYGVDVCHGGDDPKYYPDAVLYDCPDCGRSHFVTVDACPDTETAAAETASVDRRAA